jgi:hypothetical protein
MLNQKAAAQTASATAVTVASQPTIRALRRVGSRKTGARWS